MTQNETLMTMNRAQRRRFAHTVYQTQQPWTDPKYAHLTHQQARQQSWADLWETLKWDQVKARLDREDITKAFEERFPKPVRPVIEWVLRAYHWVTQHLPNRKEA